MKRRKVGEKRNRYERGEIERREALFCDHRPERRGEELSRKRS